MVDTRFGACQEPGATGPCDFCQMVGRRRGRGGGGGVDCGR